MLVTIPGTLTNVTPEIEALAALQTRPRAEPADHDGEEHGPAVSLVGGRPAALGDIRKKLSDVHAERAGERARRGLAVEAFFRIGGYFLKLHRFLLQKVRYIDIGDGH